MVLQSDVPAEITQAKFVVADLERRPEFAEAAAGPSRASSVPSHMTCGVRPPLPHGTRLQTSEMSAKMPQTPLHSVVDVEEEALADESFDGEFVICDAFCTEADQSASINCGGGTW